MTTHEYPAAQLAYERRSGLLVCHCPVPVPETLHPWGVEQCIRCGRKVVS